MKYTKGTPTLLGKIEEVDTSCTSMPYLVNRIIAVGYWFTESEIDAIVINPKRNIDHLIELWDGGKEYESASFMADFVNGNGSTTKMMQTLMKPYTEPRKYPVLTPDELKAVKWLVDGGYIAVQNYKNENVEASYGTGVWFGTEWIPIAKCLRNISGCCARNRSSVPSKCAST